MGQDPGKSHLVLKRGTNSNTNVYQHLIILVILVILVYDNHAK